MKNIWLALACIIFSVNANASEKLRIGVLLIEDSVPIYVAEQKKYFIKEGIEVEIVPFLSALERDSAIAAGAIDGAVSDPVGAILFDKGRGIIKITSLCLGQTPAEGVFTILSAPESKIRAVEDLKNVPIAVSNATIIEYVTERLLKQQGLKLDQISTIEVKKMPIRMQMLLSNAIKAATLPEPLASIAAAKGARVIISDSESKESLSQTVIIFRKDVLRNRKDDVYSFFRALGSAIQAINNKPDSYRPLFIEKGRIPPFLADKYIIPKFPSPKPFSKELFTPVMEWLSTKKLVPSLSYNSMVSTEFQTE